MNKRRAPSLTAIWILFLAPALLRAGVNQWTGTSHPGHSYPAAGTWRVAADPLHPNVVYAVSPPDVYRSDNGGLTWALVNSSFGPASLLVDPSSPSTVYLGTTVVSGPDDVYFGVLKSTDSGLTWTKTTSLSQVPFVLAASSSGRSLYGGSEGAIYKSENAGAQWIRHGLPGSPLTKDIEALVLDPDNDQTVYAGGSEYAFPDYAILSPAFVRSTDGGTTWTDLSAKLGVGPATVRTIAVDWSNPSTLFAGLDQKVGLLRSTDGGDSWAPAPGWLPAESPVLSLVVDPRNPKIMYAAGAGISRTTDGGETWTRIGQQLDRVGVNSLALDGSGRFLHAATPFGPFDLEMRDGPLDVSSGAAGKAHVLGWDADRLSVQQLDGSGNWTNTPSEAAIAGWNATAISDGSDGLSRVLWQSGEGRIALEIVGSAGRQASFSFPAAWPWTALDLSVGADNQTHLLWTSAKGEVRITSTDSSWTTTVGPTYGPYDGWSACAIADGPDGASWVLWRHSDGRTGVARYRDGVFERAFRWSANPGWAAEDIAVGKDGHPRVLWISTDGRMGIGTVDARGQLFDRKTYSSPGPQARRIGTSSDGLTQVLWTGVDRGGSLWLLNPDNSLKSQHPTPAN